MDKSKPKIIINDIKPHSLTTDQICQLVDQYFSELRKHPMLRSKYHSNIRKEIVNGKVLLAADIDTIIKAIDITVIGHQIDLKELLSKLKKRQDKLFGRKICGVNKR